MPILSKLMNNIFLDREFDVNESEKALGYKPVDTLKVFKQILK